MKKLKQSLAVAAAWAAVVFGLVLLRGRPVAQMAALVASLEILGFALSSAKLVPVALDGSSKARRIFAAALLVLFGVIGFGFVGRQSVHFAPVICTGVLLCVAGLAVPALLGPVQALWFPLAHAVMWLFTQTGLVLTYFTALLITGVLMRITGKDPLDRRFDPNATTYWKKREPKPKRGEEHLARYQRQF